MAMIPLRARPLTRRNFEQVHLFTYLIVVIELVNGINGMKGSAMTSCPNFLDTRSNMVRLSNGSHTGTELKIPEYISSRGEVLRFILTPGKLNCDGEAQKTEILFENNLPKSPSEIKFSSLARSFETVEEAGKPYPSQFTSDGHFIHGKHFLSPSTDFCVNSISDMKLELLTCPQKCDGNAKTGDNNENTFCLPKCCAMDEALLWTQCVKIDQTGNGNNPYWKPDLYQHRWHGEYRKVPQEDIKNKLKLFLGGIPSNCNAGPNYTMNVNATEENGGFYEDDGPYLKPYSSVFVEGPYGNDSFEMDHVRLTIDKNGNVKPLLLYVVTRSWQIEEDFEFCADAVMDKDNGRIKSDGFMIFYCSKPITDTDSKLAFQKSIVYTVFSFVSMPFLLLTVGVYLALLDKLNLHGLTILSYSIAEFMAYILLIMAQLVFLDHWEWIGIRRRGWPCYLLAIVSHYFYFASQVWLLMMNVDLWMTFKNLVAKRDSKELKKFTFYSVVAWGVPLILVMLFIIIDEVYRDPTLGIPVPDYANSACFVSPNFRGLYVHLPVAIIMSANIVLIFLTLKIFFDARKQNKQSLGDSSARVNASKYNAKLFAKLFIMMGGASLIDFLSWVYTKTEAQKPWPVVILESLTYLIPIILFYLFCLDDKKLNQLQEKFPHLKSVIVPMKKLLKRGGESSSSDSTLTTDSSNNKKDKVPLKPTNFGKKTEYASTGYSNSHC